jgi:DNA polymerase elongation subunit (family B)
MVKVKEVERKKSKEESEEEEDSDEVEEVSEEEDSREDKPREFIFSPYWWGYEEIDDRLIINISGHNEKNETVQIIVDDFQPYAMVELPVKIRDKKIRWTKSKCRAVFNYFRQAMPDYPPIGFKRAIKKNIYHEDEMLTLQMIYKTHTGCKKLAARCNNRYGLNIDGVGFFPKGSVRVHEHNVDPIMKFATIKDLKLKSWIKIKEKIPKHYRGTRIEDRKFSSAAIDIYASWKDFEPFTPKEHIVVRHKFVSFDLEVYSANHNAKNPDPDAPANRVFQIGLTIGFDGDKPEKRTHELLSLFEPHENKDKYTLYTYKTEKDLILGFRDRILELDPDAMWGYNIMKFDWNYLLVRAKMLGIESKFSRLTKIYGKNSQIQNPNWTSSAYGEQNFSYPDPVGRLNVDVMIEVERNYKLLHYNLNFVADYFLKEQKDPISYRQIFMLYDLTEILLPVAKKLCEKVGDEEVSRKDRIQVKKKIHKILTLRWCSGLTLNLRMKLLNFRTGSNLLWLVRQAITLVGIYCVQDTILPMNIGDKLGLWTTMEQTANTMNVPMSYLHTRGQQVKVLGQVYRESYPHGYLIPAKNPDPVPDPYQGADVFNVVPGNYDDVDIFDFESLYPCMIRLMNMCYTTILKEGDPTPDSECHLVHRVEHRGCPHDKSGKKVAKNKILCKDVVYRFRKVKVHPDGTIEGEGLIPKLERNLMKERKVVKKEMAIVAAKIDCATGKATEEERKDYEAWGKREGFDVPAKGSLTPEQIDVLVIYKKVLNARQLALKVSANSVYGGFGAPTGFFPMIPIAASVTAMGRVIINEAIRYIVRSNPGDPNNMIVGEPYGKAKLVYGDTDSCLIKFIGFFGRVAWDKGVSTSKATTHYLRCWTMGIDENKTIKAGGKKYKINEFPRRTPAKDPKVESLWEEISDKDKILIHTYDFNPVNLQFESYYMRLVMLSKKRYMTFSGNSEGKIIAKTDKGTVTARRDGSKLLRDAYTNFKNGLLNKEPEAKIMQDLYSAVYNLFSGQVPYTHFIMYKGIKTVTFYAKKNANGVHIDSKGQEFKPTSAEDPRLIYNNLPHVNLARKMIARGDDIPPNTRMEYVYLEGTAKRGSDKTEDFTYFRDNRKALNLKIDYMFYAESQLSTPFSEIITVAFKKEVVGFEKLEDKIERLLLEANEIAVHNMRLLPQKLEKKVKKTQKSSFDINSPPGVVRPKARTYTFRGNDLYYELILESFRIGERQRREADSEDGDGEINFQDRHLDPKEEPELYNAVLQWKSTRILEKVYHKFGLRKRPQWKPSNRGDILRIVLKQKSVRVMVLYPTKGLKRYDIVKLLCYVSPEGKEISAVEMKGISKEEKEVTQYSYKVEFEGKTLVVKRRNLTPFYYKDARVMETLCLAHGHFRETMEDLEYWKRRIMSKYKNA